MRDSLRLIQLTTDGEEIIVYDVWDEDDRREVAARIRSLIADGYRFVFHNAEFDLRFLHEDLGVTFEEFGAVDDTMIMWRYKAPRTFVSLKELAKKRVGLELDKDIRDTDWSASELSDEQIEYAALDCKATFRVFENLISDMPPAYDEACRGAIVATAIMKHNGLPVDQGALQTHIDTWTIEADELELQVAEALPDINVRSGQQLSVFFESKYPDKLDNWPRTKTGWLKTSEEILRDQHIPEAELISRYKNLKSSIKNFGEGVRKFIEDDGRIRPALNLCYAATTRYTSAKPNIQQMPTGRGGKESNRDIFVASQDEDDTQWVLVGADWDGMELRAAAWQSNDTVLLNAYAEGVDVHTLTAQSIFGVTEISRDQRAIAKVINFGLIYGMGAPLLQTRLRLQAGQIVSMGDAKYYRQRFFQTYHGLKEWQEETAYIGEKERHVSTRLGHRVEVRKKNQALEYTKALNIPIQGSCAEALQIALGKLTGNLDRGRLLTCVHDEILLESHPDTVKCNAKALEQAMIEGFLYVFPDSPGAENLARASVGANWLELK